MLREPAGGKLITQLNEANDLNIPYAVIFGEDELKSGTVKLKELATRTEETVSRADLPAVIRTKFQKKN